jgi:hypothetical protein
MFEVSGWILLFHAAATLAMVRLIWFVQVVHYPLFYLVSGRVTCFNHVKVDPLRQSGALTSIVTFKCPR